MQFVSLQLTCQIVRVVEVIVICSDCSVDFVQIVVTSIKDGDYRSVPYRVNVQVEWPIATRAESFGDAACRTAFPGRRIVE